MSRPLQRDAVLDCVEALAEDIARVSPECADKAMKIAGFVQELKFEPDRGAIQDAIEHATVDADISETRVRVTTSAVLGAMKNDPD